MQIQTHTKCDRKRGKGRVAGCCSLSTTKRPQRSANIPSKKNRKKRRSQRKKRKGRRRWRWRRSYSFFVKTSYGGGIVGEETAALFGRLFISCRHEIPGLAEGFYLVFFHRPFPYKIVGGMMFSLIFKRYFPFQVFLSPSKWLANEYLSTDSFIDHSHRWFSFDHRFLEWNCYRNSETDMKLFVHFFVSRHCNRLTQLLLSIVSIDEFHS